MLVVCNGMIRSGSTLQYNFVREILSYDSEKATEAHGYMDGNAFAQREEQFNAWAADNAWHVVKVHDLLPDMRKRVREGGIRVCYIYRDIRDVAASVRLKWNHRGTILLDRIDHALELYAEVRRLPSVCVQQYEQVIREPVTAVLELASYLRVSLSVDEAVAIATNWSLANVVEITQDVSSALTLNQRIARLLRRHAKSAIGRIALAAGLRPLVRWLFPVGDPIDPATLLHADHISINAGAVGRFREVLTTAEVLELETRYAEWLQDHDYVYANISTEDE